MNWEAGYYKTITRVYLTADVGATGGWCGRMFYVATRSALVAQDEMGEKDCEMMHLEWDVHTDRRLMCSALDKCWLALGYKGNYNH